MRTILITYCLLTLLFTGGCVLLLTFVSVAIGPEINESVTIAEVMTDTILAGPGLIVLFSAVANAIFLFMALKTDARRAFVGAGILYIAAQCALAWRLELWEYIGAASLMVFAVFVLKGAVLVFAGLEEKRG